MKWMSNPSISVMNWGWEFSCASHLPPVVIGRPIPRERLNEGELHALRKIGDGFLLGESRGLDAPTQIGQVRLWKLHLKRTKSGLITHGYAPF